MMAMKSKCFSFLYAKIHVHEVGKGIAYDNVKFYDRIEKYFDNEANGLCIESKQMEIRNSDFR